MLQLTAGTAMLVAASLLAVCRLRIRGAAPFVLASMTVGSAIVVGGTILLSAFDAYRPGAMLALQFAVLVVAAAFWFTGGRPRPIVGRIPDPARLRAKALQHRTVAVLLAVAGAAALIELFLGLAVAPNTWDGLMYHLSRVAMWIQNSSAFGLDGGTIYETQHQANGEMLYGWTMLLFDADRFVATIQWLAAIGCATVVFWGARTLSYSRSESAFAAAVFFCFPQIVAQASSTFVDLPAALFVGVFALFAIRAIREKDMSDVVIASLAAGLAIGTKGTAFLAVPGLALVLGACLVRWRPTRRQVSVGVATVGLGVVILGSSKYIENQIEVGSPQGTAGDDVTRVESLPRSLGQTLWTFVDVPGLQGTLPQQVLQGGSTKFFPNGTDPGPGFVSEDWVAYGIIGWLVLLPALAWFALAPSSRRTHRLVAWASISYILAHAVVVETEHYAPHTMITGVMIGAPLLASVARYGWLRHLIAFIAICSVFPILLQNEKKGLWPNWSPGLTRAEQQGLPTAYGESIAKIDGVLDEDARIAYVGPRAATWDYPFFGPSYDRFVYRVEAYATPSQGEIERWVSTEDLDAIVWSGVAPPKGTAVERIGKIAGSPTMIEMTEK